MISPEIVHIAESDASLHFEQDEVYFLFTDTRAFFLCGLMEAEPSDSTDVRIIDIIVKQRLLQLVHGWVNLAQGRLRCSPTF